MFCRERSKDYELDQRACKIDGLWLDKNTVRCFLEWLVLCRNFVTGAVLFYSLYGGGGGGGVAKRL